MNHQKKKRLKHQLLKKKAINFVATASSVGLLGVVTTQTSSVKAETLDSISAIVAENNVESIVTIVGEQSTDISTSEIDTEINDESESLLTTEKTISEEENTLAATPVTREVEVSDKIAHERIVGMPYKVTYTDIESNTVVKSEHKSVAITTTEAIAATEVMEVASVPSGYKLAENQPSMLKANVTEKQRNTLNFNVVEDVESAVSVTRGVNFRSETDDANSQPYGTIENYTHRDTYLKNGELTNISS